MATCRSAKALRLVEVLQQGTRLNGESVRVVGKVTSVNTTTQLLVLEHEGSLLSVSFSLCDPRLSYEHGALYLFIGEIEYLTRVRDRLPACFCPSQRIARLESSITSSCLPEDAWSGLGSVFYKLGSPTSIHGKLLTVQHR